MVLYPFVMFLRSRKALHSLHPTNVACIEARPGADAGGDTRVGPDMDAMMLRSLAAMRETSARQ
jgi:hypothetical protein